MSLLGELLSDLNVELPEVISAGRVLKIVRAEAGNTLNINLELDETVAAEELTKSSESISKALEGADVSLYPKFKTELFTDDYIFEIIGFLKNKYTGVNGYFDEARVSAEGTEYTIALKSGGKNILMGLGMDKKIENYVRGFFDKNISVKITAEDELDLDEYVRREQSAPLQQVSITESAPPVGQAPFSGQGERSYSRGGGGNRRSQVLAEPQKITLPFEHERFDREASLFFGKGNFEHPSPMSESFYDQDEATLWGEVFKTDEKMSKDGKTLIFTAYFSDKTSSHILKIITGAENTDAIKDNIKSGKTILVSGKFEVDTFTKNFNIRPYSIASIKTHSRKDNAEFKRVELHMHSNMSDMDAITPPAELIKQAHAWGHKAVAITDHGNVQAYPEAMNTIEKINKDGAQMKMIYGVEAYFVNDSGALISGCGDYPINEDIIVFDLETTGISSKTERITEIGAVKLRNMEIVEEFQTFVDPERDIPAEITNLTGITDEMVAGAPKEKQAVEDFIKFAGNGVLVAHNADFDTSFISAVCERQGIDYPYRYADTLA
ncbi:MAG: PHP domain-containing protein, partial [Oscillospiraceae bacterium]|nr:PHP domain-containing protein [Oscillospiraceae bacterium]